MLFLSNVKYLATSPNLFCFSPSHLSEAVVLDNSPRFDVASQLHEGLSFFLCAPVKRVAIHAVATFLSEYVLYVMN